MVIMTLMMMMTIRCKAEGNSLLVDPGQLSIVARRARQSLLDVQVATVMMMMMMMMMMVMMMLMMVMMMNDDVDDDLGHYHDDQPQSSG